MAAMDLSPLDDIPDPQGQSSEEILDWVNRRVVDARTIAPTPETIASFAPVELSESAAHPFGAEGDATWRRFFLATLVADWACYEREVDRVDFPRLKYIMSSASRYFRLWCCRLPDGSSVPVGYSAGYPIPKFVFDGIMRDHAGIDDRGVFLPQRFIQPDAIRHAYIINVSIAAPLRNTSCSVKMLRAMQRDGKRLGNASAMAITVDEAGSRFSRIGGFSRMGEIIVGGEREALFVRHGDGT